MNLSDRFVLPHLIALAMRTRALAPYRARIVSQASGRVLEIGVGAGPNLPFYDPILVKEVIGLDRSPALLAKAKAAGKHSTISFSTIESPAETIPLETASVDSVVMTWTLCSIADPRRALNEIHRVLKPGGKLLFVEHGRAPEKRVHNWQIKLTPYWKRCSGGCHLDRPIDRLIEEAGFGMMGTSHGYMRGPKLFTFMYEGAASRRGL